MLGSRRAAALVAARGWLSRAAMNDVGFGTARGLSSASDGAPVNRLQRIDSFFGMGSRAHRQGGPRTAEDAVNNILYNTPAATGKANRHILNILVDNEPGVLSKVSGLLSARGVNIDSLSVSSTDVRELSRMTIVLVGPDAQIEQAGRQLEDLCDVWAVVDHNKSDVLERELVILKINCIPPPEGEDEIPLITRKVEGETLTSALSYDEMMAAHFHRQAVLETAKMFGASVVDVGSETIILEMVSWSKRVDAFIRIMQPYGIVEAARSGTIAMNRSAVIACMPEDEISGPTTIDLANLPPS